MKTTTQQQMTTQRPARGLSLLACSLFASLPLGLLSALAAVAKTQDASDAASKGFSALAAAAAAANNVRHRLPAPYYQQHRQWLAFHGAYWEPTNNIRGGNP